MNKALSKIRYRIKKLWYHLRWNYNSTAGVVYKIYTNHSEDHIRGYIGRYIRVRGIKYQVLWVDDGYSYITPVKNTILID